MEFFTYQITKTASDIIIATPIIIWYCGGYEETDHWRKQFRDSRTFNVLTGPSSYIRLNFFPLTLFSKKFLHGMEYMRI